MNHNKKNNFYERQKSLINENVNVSKTNEVKDMFVLLAGICVIIVLFLFSFDLFANLYIDNMSSKTQHKIQNTLAFNQNNLKLTNHKLQKNVQTIKNKIFKNDINLINDTELDIYITNKEEKNAYVLPDGNIYITKGLLNEPNISNEELTFVIAHEIAHYVKKHHLKSISHQIGLIIITSFIGANTTKVIDSIGEMESLAHSRKQEKEADIYANKMLIKIYGSNRGAKRFITRMKDSEHDIDFFKYFSTHPSWNDRLEIANSIQNK